MKIRGNQVYGGIFSETFTDPWWFYVGSLSLTDDPIQVKEKVHQFPTTSVIIADANPGWPANWLLKEFM